MSSKHPERKLAPIHPSFLKKKTTEQRSAEPSISEEPSGATEQPSAQSNHALGKVIIESATSTLRPVDLGKLARTLFEAQSRPADLGKALLALLAPRMSAPALGNMVYQILDPKPAARPNSTKSIAAARRWSRERGEITLPAPPAVGRKTGGA